MLKLSKNMFRILSEKETNALQVKCFGKIIPNAFEGVELDGTLYFISVNNKLWRIEEDSLLNPSEQEHQQIAANINVIKAKQVIINAIKTGMLHEVLISLVVDHPEVVDYLEEAQSEWIK
jgi:hypothetical protein